MPKSKKQTLAQLADTTVESVREALQVAYAIGHADGYKVAFDEMQIRIATGFAIAPKKGKR